MSKPISNDAFILLRLFENHRGIDVPQSWTDLLQRYHSVYENPDKRPKTSWRPERLRKALNEAEAQGLIELQRSHNWTITSRGLEVRREETVRRMKS